MNDEEDERQVQLTRSRICHFWIAEGPFFKTSLVVAPMLNDEESGEHDRRHRSTYGSVGGTAGVRAASPVRMTVYDPDGEQVNDITVELQPDVPEAIEFSQFMASCKVESGLTHAHLVVQTPHEMRCGLTIERGGLAMPLGEPMVADKGGSVCIPVVSDATSNSLLAIVNYEQFPASVRLTLYYRSQEHCLRKMIPPNGVRLMHIPAEFSHLPTRGGRLGYVEVAVEGGGDAVGVQWVSEHKGVSDHHFYRAIA